MLICISGIYSIYFCNYSCHSSSIISIVRNGNGKDFSQRVFVCSIVQFLENSFIHSLFLSVVAQKLSVCVCAYNITSSKVKPKEWGAVSAYDL